jgi:methionyl-tRNA synthetase
VTDQTVEVRFKGNRRIWHIWPGHHNSLQLNEGVVVQAERGQDFGWVNRREAVASCDGCTSCATGTAQADDTAPLAEPPEAIVQPQIIRRANAKDVKQHEELRRSEEDVRRHITTRVGVHQLPMRISDTEWQWDGNRLTVYFTSDRRVDFRELVRELASHFRTRIDLRQIGVREEAARLGGVGRCGREYCCSTWLTEPSPVNLALAKDQRLSLNPSQISGGCGRLLCCLKYEHEFYLNSRKRFPKEGRAVRTLLGTEKVIAVDIFRERVYLRGEESSGRVIPLIQYREEVDQAATSGQSIAPPSDTNTQARQARPKPAEKLRVKPFYITTAIDYANGDPHLGHALEKIGADVIARWHRLQGQSVRFLMGMDEHGQKVYQAAMQHGDEPKAWVDTISDRFNATWLRLDCSHDIWMRTTEARHARGVTALIEQIRSRHPDDLFTGEYEGLYCVGCEEFKQESDLVNGRCPEHPTRDLVPTKEHNTFFRLSRWGDAVKRAIASGEFKVEPDIRRNEILRVLEAGLQDISVSRGRLPWGIPFPGSDDQTVYVWFDALINYLSATGYPDGDWEELWPADVHVIGKGITRFHCLVWPAMLLAAGVALPKLVWAHGYVQWDGAKVSKSEGTFVSLDEVISRHDPDALRYYLMREVGFQNDGDFTFERFDARYTSDLADGLGNLASRVTAMVLKYRDGLVPTSTGSETLDQSGAEHVSGYRDAMNALDLKGATQHIEQLVSAANGYITVAAPWALAKAGDDEKLDAVLGSLMRCLVRLSVMIAPFMPGKAATLWNALGQPTKVEESWGMALAPDIAGTKITKPENLFPKDATR